MLKYDWNRVPKDVLSIAMDDNGRIKGFESHCPTLFSREWSSNYCYYDLTKFIKGYEGDWKDSLEVRPKELGGI